VEAILRSGIRKFTDEVGAAPVLLGASSPKPLRPLWPGLRMR
jgi:hypothetical protein